VAHGWKPEREALKIGMVYTMTNNKSFPSMLPLLSPPGELLNFNRLGVLLLIPWALICHL
jgi:hypothetical protein